MGNWYEMESFVVIPLNLGWQSTTIANTKELKWKLFWKKKNETTYICFGDKKPDVKTV